MRVGPRKRTVGYVEEADRVERRRCSTPDDFVAAVENLCIVRVKGSFRRFGKDPKRAQLERKTIQNDKEEFKWDSYKKLIFAQCSRIKA